MSYRYNPLSGKIEFVGISTSDGTSLEATINEKVANLVDSAPTTLDTLNELAAALNNDPNFATSTATLIGTKADTSSLSSVATSGAYADLTGKPENLSSFTNDSGYITGYTVTESDVTGHESALTLTESQISDLGSYLTSVAFSDLTNTPTTISGYGITDAFDGDYANLTNKPDLFDGAYSSLSGVPTALSSFTNDSGYITGYTVTESDVTGHESALTITESQISDLGTYLVAADLSSYATQTYVNAQGFITGYTVTESDVTGHESALTITESQISDLADYLISADLSGYATETFVVSQGYITDYTVTESDVTGHQIALSITESQISDLQSYLTTVAFADLTSNPTTIAGYGITDAFDGDYDSLTNKPTIPTVPTTVSSFTNDSGYITGYTVTQDDLSGLTITESQITDLGSYLVSSDLSTYALTTYVDTQVAGVVNSAPETLNTLNELATALGNDPDFATSTANLIGTKANTADLSAVATSGAYTDLIGAPSLFDGAYSSLSGAPTNVSTFTNDSGYLTTVSFDDLSSSPTTVSGYGITDAFSGAYGDLTGVPTNISTFANDSGYLTTISYAEVTGKPTLFDGAYSSLSGAPTNVSTFSNDSGYLTAVAFADLTSKPTTVSGYGITDAFDGAYSSLSGAPTNVSTFSNDSGYLTTVSFENLTSTPTTVSGYGITDAFDGAYSSLSGAPTNVSTFSNDSGYLTTVAFSDLTSKPTTVSGYGITDAFDGAYSSLSGAPTNVSTFTNDSGYLTTVAFSDLTSNPTTIAGYGITDAFDGDYVNLTNKPTIPTALSSFSNDTNFITLNESQSGVSVTSVSASGSGSLNYNNANGVFTFAPADLSSYLTSSDLTGYATETYVATQVAGVVSSAPETLDTLNELAAALGDDPNFATTVSTQIGTKIGLGDLSINTVSASGAGSLNYGNSTGEFTFSPADLSSYLTSVAFSDLTTTPTTISGYGITDAFDGDYANLTNKPTIPEGADLTGYATETYVNSQGFLTTVAYVDLTSKPTTIAGYGITDAFSGAYGDLTGAPTLFDGAYSSLTDAPTVLSSFSNDTNFIDLTRVSVSSVAASGSGSLNYNNANGVFTFAPADLSSYLVASDLSTYATEAFVSTQVANVVNSAPEALNTLNELADALGDDPNFATTISTQIGTKAALGDFNVNTVSSSGSGSLNYNSSTGAFTFSPADLSSFLTSYTETDPVFTAHPSSGITTFHIQQWNTAYTWGDHSTVGYLTTETQADYNQTDSGAVDFIKNKPTLFNGDYGSLTNQPTIPTNNNELTNGAGYLTTVSYDQVTGKPTLFDGDYGSLSNQPTIPTNNNELTNGAGYLALVSVPSTSKGASGDAAGDVATDNDYIYRCTANYTDGNADIWKRVAFSTDTW